MYLLPRSVAYNAYDASKHIKGISIKKYVERVFSYILTIRNSYAI